MLLLVLAFLGGILTILSPCILPVLPFVFARADQPLRRSGLPLLVGMALTFTAFAAVATTGGAWLVRANQYGRIAALVVLTLFALTLLSSKLAELVTRPFVQAGNRLAQPAGVSGSPGRSLLLGVATGLLWAPCAGPILGLILTGAALNGASGKSAVLLLAYALGAATSLAIALFAGSRVFSALKRSMGAEEWIRRILGIAVLAGVVMIAAGLDRGLLTRLSQASTSGIEQSLINRLHAGKTGNTSQESAEDAAIPKTMPELAGATQWFNSQPLNREALRGHVVLVDFWTYSCINCLRTIPYIRAWADKYKSSGLIIIGVHTPEFAFEKDPDNVRKAIAELGITYPVALDNDYKIWEAFNNSYWPADYLIDGDGHVRHHEFGEGGYDETERAIQSLLKEANASSSFTGLVNVKGSGAEAASTGEVKSPETYVGYDRAENVASPGGLRQDKEFDYSVPASLNLNQWGLAGKWTDKSEAATLDAPGGRIAFRFHARDLHLVLGSTPDGKPIRFRVTLDGKAPGVNHGADIDAQGNGSIKEHRLYQLIRQNGDVADHTFLIEFLDSGAQAFAFTFG